MDLRLKRKSGRSPGDNGAGEPIPVGEGCGGDSCDLSIKVSGGGSHLKRGALPRSWEPICVENFLGWFKPKISLRKSDRDTEFL